MADALIAARATWGVGLKPDTDRGAHAGLDLAGPVTFLIGAEREGLPDDLVAQSHKLTIELPGEAESLNVAAAGAIALYEASHGRMSQGRG